MRLSGRLILAFAVAAVVPMGVTAFVTRRFIRAEFSEHYERRLETAERTLRVVYGDQVLDQRSRLESLCAGDPLLDSSLTRLARSRREPLLRSQLEAWTNRQATALGLDTLDVLSPDGEILASAHYEGRVGEREPELAELARRAEGSALLADVSLREGARDLSAMALLTSCRVRREGAELLVVGGRLTGRTLSESISSRLEGGDVLVFVLDEDRRPVGAGAARWRQASRLRRVLLPLQNPDGATRAWLAIAVDDARERAAVRRLERMTLAVVALGMAIAWLLGMLVARHIARPLALLANRAGEVAAGDLEGPPLKVGSSGEVRDLVVAFNTMTVDLREYRDRVVRAERIAAWRDIARRIAHEIKNPLFPIQTSIETIQKAYRKQHPDFEEIFEEATVTILEEVERLKRIVTEFSRFARLPRPEAEPLEVEDLVSGVTSMYAGQKVPVHTRLASGLPQIRADREQLTQVLHNLIQNAIDACEGVDGAAVELIGEAIEAGVSLAVRDNGSGIDEETLAKIFEPDVPTKEGRGTGLGLAIVHRIVTDHGGTLHVDTAPGRGSTFTVRLTTAGPPPERGSLAP
jgi:two-component system nitrogen regulation sensor histidine kinase NtrY